MGNSRSWPGRSKWPRRRWACRVGCWSWAGATASGSGHVDESEAVVRLRECFALYLNYPFGPLDSSLRRYSFPTKLGTYALAARPILIHAPEDCSVMPLTEIPGYAKHWGSLGEGDGTPALVQMWNDPRASESRHAEAESIRLRYYDPGRNRRTLFEALNGLVQGDGR
jgi:hypothetical protein